MLVDRRKDNYDELSMLSRDARQRRQKTSRWTTALVASGMVAGAAYVASTSAQVDALKDAAKQADVLRDEIAMLIDERDALRIERDVYRQTQDWYAQAAPQLRLGDQIANLARAMGTGSPGSGSAGETGTSSSVVRENHFGLADVVWLVDGSRRFPMAENDYLWIPEAGTWIQLESIANKTVRVFDSREERQARPNPAEEAGRQEGVSNGLQLDLTSGGGPGNTRYACISLHRQTSRPGFPKDRYADIEILFLAGECPPVPAED